MLSFLFDQQLPGLVSIFKHICDELWMQFCLDKYAKYGFNKSSMIKTLDVNIDCKVVKSSDELRIYRET